MRLTILLWSILPILAVATPIYKWVDSKGITQYTQEPPAQGNAQPLSPQVVGVGPERANEILNELRKSFSADAAARSKLEAEQAKAQAQLKDKEARLRRCEEARARLESLLGSRRVAVKDAQGEYRRIDDDERASLVKQTEALIQEVCQ